jgi:hypothetical protein
MATKQVNYNGISGNYKKSIEDVMDSLGDEEFSFYNFDITKIADPSSRSKIFFALKVIVPRAKRTKAANLIARNIASKGYSAYDTKGTGNQLDVTVDGKILRIDIKPQGGGSGGGAAETARNEAAQCLYASLAFNVYKKEIDPTLPISLSDFEKASQTIDVDVPFEQLLPDELDREWQASSIKGANKLFQTFNSSGKNYIFCRGGGPDDKEIKRAYQRARKSMLKDPDVKVVFSSEDKWNPADIWMVSTTFNPSDLDQYKTVDTINQFLKEKYEERELIGVSLKKMKGDAKLKVLNFDPNQKIQELDQVSFAGYWSRYKDDKKKATDDGYPMDIYLYWKTGSNSQSTRFQARNFGGASSPSWQLELKGVSAAQGRCGGGSVVEILKSLNVSYQGITSGWDNKTLWADCKPTNKSKKDAITNELISLFNKYSAPRPTANYPGEVQARMELGNRSQSYRYSKLMGLRLLDCIKTSGKEDEIMKALYTYAGSQTDKSSVHVKLMD